MQSLSKGESPTVTLRLPPELIAAIDAAAGRGHGARSRYIRALIERETAPGRRTRGRSSQGTTVKKGTH